MSERERLSLPQQLVRKFPRGVRIGLAGIVGAGSLGLTACGPGRGEVQPQQAPSIVAPAQAQELASPTASPTEAPKPTATAEARSTATPIGIGGPNIPKFGLPEIDAIGEKLANESTRGQVPEKDVVRWNAVVRLDALSKDVDSLPDSLDPRISKEEFESKKRGIEFEIQAVKEAFAKGEMQEARKIMYRTEQSSMGTVVYGILGPILALGDPLQSKFVPPDIKKDHDPKDKYIGKSRVDPRIYNVYLSSIDVLVATDPSY